MSSFVRNIKKIKEKVKKKNLKEIILFKSIEDKSVGQTHNQNPSNSNTNSN